MISQRLRLSAHVLSAVCLSIAGNSALAQSPPTAAPVTIPPGCPSVGYWRVGPEMTPFGTDIIRHVRVNPAQAIIEVSWKQTDMPLPTITMPNQVLTSTVENIAVAFWPTSVKVMDPYHFCVVGKGRNNSVVLEYWTFATTAAGGGAAPSVISYSTPTQPVNYTWLLPPRSRATEILRDDATTTGLVSAMFRDPASAQRVYLWYANSREVRRVDVTTGTSVLVASPTTGSGVLAVPPLTSEYDSFSSADYAGIGHCLFFAKESRPGGYGIVLIDANYDGVMDSFSQITAASWEADGFADDTRLLASY